MIVLTEGAIIFGLLTREARRRSTGIRHEDAPANVLRGAPLPELSGFLAATKTSASWSNVLRPGRNLIVFLTPHCTSCNKIARLLESWLQDNEEHAVVIAEGRVNGHLKVRGFGQLKVRTPEVISSGDHLLVSGLRAS